MSRFKVGERIERALQSGVVAELDWAERYCASRLEDSTLKQHENHWRALLTRVRDKLAEVSEV